MQIDSIVLLIFFLYNINNSFTYLKSFIFDKRIILYQDFNCWLQQYILSDSKSQNLTKMSLVADTISHHLLI